MHPSRERHDSFMMGASSRRLRREEARTPSPRGKLDTMQVNGPEGDPGWDSVDWGQAEENVRRLRRRIFAASQAGDLKRVRSLQKLMLRSRSSALASVRRVTEVSAGRRTAGVDGRIVLAGRDKADMAAWLRGGAAGWRPLPVRRVHAALTGYRQQRRRRDRLPVDPATWHLLRRQRGRCPPCRGLPLHADRRPQSPEEWQQWHTATRKAIRKHAIASVTDLGTPDERAAYHLIHAYCRNRIGNGTSTALLPGPQPSGLA